MDMSKILFKFEKKKILDVNMVIFYLLCFGIDFFWVINSF